MNLKIINPARASVLASTGRSADYAGIQNQKEQQPAENVRGAKECVLSLSEQMRKVCGQ